MTAVADVAEVLLWIGAGLISVALLVAKAYYAGFARGYGLAYKRGDLDGWLRCHDALVEKERGRRG